MTERAQADDGSEARIGYEGWRVALAAGVGVFVASAATFAFPLLVRPLTAEFSWSRTSVSSAFGILRMSAGLSSPAMGWLADRSGARWISSACLLLLAAAFALLAMLTPPLWHFHAVFLIAGIATAGTSTVVYARTLSTWFDRYRGRALAVITSSSAVGALLIPPATQVLMRLIGWRRTCGVLGLAMVLIGVPTVVRFVRHRTSTAPLSPRSDATSGVGVPDALRSRVFLILLTVLFGSTLALNGVIVHLAALLIDRGVSENTAALAVSVLGASSLAGRLATGWLLDRFSAERLMMLLLMLASLGTLLLAGAQTLTAGIVAAALLGAGTGGEADVVPYLLARRFGLRSLSPLYGFNALAFGLAGAAGPVLMGLAYDASGSYTVTLMAFSAGTMATALLTLAMPVHEQT